MRYISLSFMALVAFLASLSHPHAMPAPDSWEGQHWQDRVALFDQSTRQAPIVMLGDSLTEFAFWDERFPDLAIANRGVAGDTTDGMVKRLSSVLSLHPQKVFILAGINDILAEHRPIKAILGSYQVLIDTLAGTGIRVHVISTLPCNPALWTTCPPDQVRALNAGLINLTKDKAIFIDVGSALSDGQGLARPYTNDGLHLTDAGYRVLTQTLAPYLTR